MSHPQEIEKRTDDTSANVSSETNNYDIQNSDFMKDFSAPKPYQSNFVSDYEFTTTNTYESIFKNSSQPYHSDIGVSNVVLSEPKIFDTPKTDTSVNILNVSPSDGKTVGESFGRNISTANLGQTETSNLKNVNESKVLGKSTLNNNANSSRVLEHPMEGISTNDKLHQKLAMEMKSVPESHTKTSQNMNITNNSTQIAPNATQQPPAYYFNGPFPNAATVQYFPQPNYYNGQQQYGQVGFYPGFPAQPQVFPMPNSNIISFELMFQVSKPYLLNKYYDQRLSPWMSESEFNTKTERVAEVGRHGFNNLNATVMFCGIFVVFIMFFILFVVTSKYYLMIIGIVSFILGLIHGGCAAVKFNAKMESELEKLFQEYNQNGAIKWSFRKQQVVTGIKSSKMALMIDIVIPSTAV
jgi:hypothetical protein